MFSPGTGAGCRPPADELYEQQKDAPEPPTAPTAQRGKGGGRKGFIYAIVTLDSGCLRRDLHANSLFPLPRVFSLFQTALIVQM